MERCRDCRFWLDAEGNLRSGTCRRYPPSWRPEADNRIAYAGFPGALAGDWCGEFSPSPIIEGAGR